MARACRCIFSDPCRAREARPLNVGQVAGLHPYFNSIPDPRSRRGRWYSLTSILLVCACAVVSGAKSIDELAEWGARASGRLLAVRYPPSPARVAAHPFARDDQARAGRRGQ
ncbi:transposase family protein [Streptomyces sp. NPDC002285]